jgi:Holliday junction resolvase RusA-like endonuclease
LEILLELKNIRIPSINSKFGRSKQGTLYLNKEYADFKRLIELVCINKKFTPPYKIAIGLHAYIDIDNNIKSYLDGISKALSNDRDILQLEVFKIRNKRGRPSNLIIFIEEIKEQYKLPNYFPSNWNSLFKE